MPNIDSTRDAREELEKRFKAAGSPGGEFCPRTRRANGEDNWTEMVCVDEREAVIPGVEAVWFRPTVTGRTHVPAIGKAAVAEATE